MISLAFSQTVAAKTGWQSMAVMVTPAKAAYSAMPGLALWRCVLVRSCFFTRDTSCDRKDVEGQLLKSRPSWAAQITGNKITPPRRMVLLVSPWHNFEHTQYSTLGFTPKSQNRANVVAGECHWRSGHVFASGTNFSSSARLSLDEYPHSTELRASIAI